MEGPLIKRIKLEGGAAAAAGGAGTGHDAQQHHLAEQQQAAPPLADGDPQQSVADAQGQAQPPAGGGGGDPQQQAAQQAGAAPPLPLPVVPDNTYMSREARHIERERGGELEARYIKNDGSIESGRLLIGLKNVFAKCLPNMPKEYICRLIFERRHKSVVIVRNRTQVIGGITYRTFPGTPAARLGEIAFCAVAQTLQVTGYGTRLMNWTKHYAREMDGLEYFLTYADNNAVGYFSKQSFTKTVTLEKDKWFGFIKDYDGGTLMECRIHPTLPYASFPDMLAKQRAALEGEVKRYTTGHVVHPGLPHWKSGGGPLPIEEIPGVLEAGWSHEAGMLHKGYQIAIGGQILDPTEDHLSDFMWHLLRKAQKHADAAPFLAPVSAEDVPDYYTIIIDPMDLGTMEERLASRRYYITLNMFAADFYKMVKNCQLYNGSQNPYFLAAKRLYEAFWSVMRSSILPNLEAAGIVEPKL
ncbi:hypothetical protein ABPG75_001638 [Micractinium tetrahymenae]